MKTIKLIHTADWHLSEKPKLQQKARHNLDQMLEYVRTNNVDGILIAGDIWDRLQPFGNNSAIKLAYEYLNEFSRLVKFIFIIKGNSSHDAHQSIELLHQYKENIFAYENNVACAISLRGKTSVTNLFEINEIVVPDILIHGISYPTKSQLIINNQIDMQNADFLECFEELMDFHGTFSKQYPAIHKVTLFHGSISGSKLSTGQTIIGQDIIIPSFILEKTLSDYYALGHIHLPQNINLLMRYSGSLYNKDFGETEEKSFDVLEFSQGGLEINSITFNQSRPMIIIDAEFTAGKFIYDKNFPRNSEIKFRYSVSESESSLITQGVLLELKKELGEDAVCEANIIPSNRISRSSKIMNVKTLYEEVEEYASVLGEEITSSMKEKIEQIELETNLEVDICA